MIYKRIIISVCLILETVFTLGQQMNAKLTEVWDPVPKKISPVIKGTAPSDAIVLFNGKDLSQWKTVKDSNSANFPDWKLEKKNVMTIKVGAGDIQTKQSFGSCQLHIEWRIPGKIKAEGQNRGNSGILFMGLYELQILDSYDNKTYSNGQAGSIYKQYIPLVNASLKPGKWQTYDIIFTAPKFNSDSLLMSPARFTVLHNGVLIQNNVELKGITVYRGLPYYKPHNDKRPLLLQEHGSGVSFRNIWIREL